MVNPSGLALLTQAKLETLVHQVRGQGPPGRLPNYIPLLAKADPNWLAVQVQTIAGQSWAAGDLGCSFPLMSVIKPFLLLFALEQVGRDQVFDRVGMEPSDQSFHSLAQLLGDRGRPRNPMLNSGAISLTSLLPGGDGAARCEALCGWLNQQAGTQLFLDQSVLKSVQSLSNEANRAIVNLLAQAGYIDQTELALDTYNRICCLAGTVADLAHLGLLLVQEREQIQLRHRQIVNALMLTCGLYEASGPFAVRIGLPMKSGVSGALLTIVPGQGAIASYSPPLDPAGNSAMALAFVESLAQLLHLSVFS